MRIIDPDGQQPSIKGAFFVTAGFVILIWTIWIADATLDLNLYRFGVYPHTISGFGGIASAPLIHASAMHLFANTPALLVLGTALVYGYPRSAGLAFCGIYFLSGIGTWLLARDGYHIGASGLTHGMLFFIFVIGVLRRDKPAIALALIVFFLHGSMIWGIFPQEARISFEAHLFGAIAGVLLAFMLRNRDPKPPEKRYGWEDGEESSDEIPIESDWKP
jgi:membrane associated rhomboid family serine protease